MQLALASEGLDPSNTWMIGDRAKDISGGRLNGTPMMERTDRDPLYARPMKGPPPDGMAGVGRAEIQKLLAEVFDLPFVMAAESETVEQSVRFIRPDVALVRSMVVRRGQKSPSGEDLGTRNTGHLGVLLKTEDSWHVVSHLISDARDRSSAHH